ncbi:TlpA disulfide reductase family protein [Geobacter argillaceus]|uniref:Peroxiredoxin n=1 Tax=Geobacter argillaceus TaxID=345631 RepID=A0A562WQB9_9BACT|nr:TlpA disulfide reductase family protein [Geobacter argillaceus]TWJ32540.1 peroxiredoxin [Geobacter argillaceus]
MKRLIALLLVMLAVVTAGCSKGDERAKGKSSAAKVVEGTMAPDFTARDMAGKEVKLSDLRGKVALVNFWATWCPPCREEIPSMVKLNQAMAGKPFQMLALSIDEGGKGAIEQFFAKSGQTLPAYLDGEQKVAGLYGTTGVPETFVVDKKGVIRKKIIGGMDWSAPEVIDYLNGLAGQ